MSKANMYVVSETALPFVAANFKIANRDARSRACSCHDSHNTVTIYKLVPVKRFRRTGDEEITVYKAK